jgi:hypothetical protein
MCGTEIPSGERMSDFLKLDEIRKANGDIKAFPLGSNLKGANSSKNGWGQVTIAVDNETVHRLITDDVVGILYVIGKEDWKKQGGE